MQSKFKKLVLILVVLTLMVSVFAGCSGEKAQEPKPTKATTKDEGKTTEPEQEQPEQAEPITVKVMSWQPAETEATHYENLVAAYMDKNPNVTIELEFLPEGYGEKITSLFAAGSPPEIFFVYNPDLPMQAINGMYTPIDKFIEGENGVDLNDVYDVAVCKWDGATYGISPNLAPQILYYNKTMFDTAGIAYPTDEWTWDDMAEAAKNLVVKDDAGKVTQYGFQCDEYNRVWYSYLISNGGSAFDDMFNPTEVAFNNQIGIDGAQYIVDLTQTFGVAPPPNVKGGLGYREAFSNGNVAMIVDGAWNFAAFNAKEGLDYGAALVPQGDAGHAVWTSVCCWVMSSKVPEENQAAVWDVLKTLSGPESAAGLGAGGTLDMMGMPSWKSVYEQEDWNPVELIQVVERQMEYADYDAIFPNAGKWYWDIVNGGLQEMVTLGKDPSVGIQEMADMTQTEILDKMP